MAARRRSRPWGRSGIHPRSGIRRSRLFVPCWRCFASWPHSRCWLWLGWSPTESRDDTVRYVDVVQLIRHSVKFGFVVVTISAMVVIAVIGMSMTVFEAVKRVVAFIRRAIRFLIDNEWRVVVGKLAPWVFPSVGFVVFSLATGEGISAIWFWLVAGIGSFFLLGILTYFLQFVGPLFEGLGNLVGWLLSLPLGLVSSRAAQRVKEASRYVFVVGPVAAVFTAVFVHNARLHSSAAPSRIPLAASGWGTYLALLLGLALVVTATKAGLGAP